MNIGAGCHPNKVKVSGPGVAKTGLKAFEPTYFTVDCAEAGQGRKKIKISLFKMFLTIAFMNQLSLIEDSIDRRSRMILSH